MGSLKPSHWTWGQVAVLAFPLFVGIVVFALWRQSATFGERFAYALIFMVSTWLLTATLRWTYVWLQAVFKK